MLRIRWWVEAGGVIRWLSLRLNTIKHAELSVDDRNGHRGTIP